MDVVIGGRRVQLQAKDALGSGGEATITRVGNVAVKVYHTPSPQKAEKLAYFVKSVTPHLPPEVIGPQVLVQQPKTGAVVGFCMTALDPGYEVLAMLSKRSHRGANGFGTRFVADLFSTAHQTLAAIHKAGAVVGDLNDLNELFAAPSAHPQLVWIDVDSFQVGHYPCEVATETFLDPLLYGPDITKPVLTGGVHRVFRPENDWYSFAVMLFRSLTLVHPYGGVDTSLPSLPRRAQAGRSVFASSVTYPAKVGYALEILSDPLTTVMRGIFEHKERAVFPVSALEAYAASLVACKSCGAEYPRERKRCPACAAAAPIQQVTTHQDYEVQDLVTAEGEVLALTAHGALLRCVVTEKGVLYLYEVEGSNVWKTRLGADPGAKDVDVSAHWAGCVNRLGVPSLKLLWGGKGHVASLRTSTERFGTHQGTFCCTPEYYYRAAGGMILRGTLHGTTADERPVTAVSSEQTWIAASKQGASVGDVLCGCFRVFHERHYFLVVGPNRVDLGRADTDISATVIEEEVLFSDKLVTLLRLTKDKGVDYVDTRIFDFSGKCVLAYTERVSERVAGGVIRGGAFANHSLLFATDRGVVREKFDVKATQNPVEKKVLTATEPFVASESVIVPFQGGLAVTHGTRVRLIKPR